MSMMSRPAALAALVLVARSLLEFGWRVAPHRQPPATPSRPTERRPEREPGTVGAIEHKTGADRRGPPLRRGRRVRDAGLLAAQAPIFTLYGDGTLIFRNPAMEALPAVGSVMPLHPFRTAEAERGADPGPARIRARRGRPRGGPAEYQNIDGRRRLDRGLHGQRRRPERRSRSTRSGSSSTGTPDAPLAPQDSSEAARPPRRHRPGRRDHDRRLRARALSRRSCSRASPAPRTRSAWPWPDVKTADFVSNGDPNAFQLPARVMTAAGVEALGIEPFAGRLQGLPLTGPATASSTRSRCARSSPTRRSRPRPIVAGRATPRRSARRRS